MYSFNETDDQLDTLNKLIFLVIEKHAPLSKTKFKPIRYNVTEKIGDMKCTKIQQAKAGEPAESLETKSKK